ncbi:MAG: hypothetical protein PHV16_05240 [Candidatus Nanoarchaeia archaeon]|nr:hypothetical protein [Candidatus Nanoarchaeia archaeon]
MIKIEDEEIMDVYANCEDLCEDDEISLSESAFMEGYNSSTD